MPIRSNPCIFGNPRRRRAIKEFETSLGEFSLRRMTRADIASVMAIEELSFTNPWRAMTFLGEIENFPISIPQVIVSPSEERIIGYVFYWIIGSEAQIANFALHPDFRRLGIGKKVMIQVLEAMRSQGGKIVILEVRPSNNAAIALYKGLGFKVLGIRQDYYTKPSEDAMVMGKVL